VPTLQLPDGGAITECGDSDSSGPELSRFGLLPAEATDRDQAIRGMVYIAAIAMRPSASSITPNAGW
jgi:GST-like protein